MRSIYFLLIFGILLFGCVQMPAPEPAPTVPAVVNITQNQTTAPETGNGKPDTPTGPVTVDINATTTQDTKPETQDTLASLSQEEVKFKTQDSWEIHGTLYHSENENPSTGIILVHMLNSDRSGLDPLIPILHEELPDADLLAIDMRGHGKSTNLGTIAKFKLAGDYRAMYKDIIGAKEYLAFFRHTPDNYYIVGASIGSSAAIRVPQEESSFQKIVMISPGMNYKGVDITDDLDFYRKRLLIVTASGDVQSASDSQTAYSLSQANFKKLVVYENTSAHGTDLFDATENLGQIKLTKLIADWLNEG